MDTIFDFMEPFEDFLIILNRHRVNISDVKYFPAYREHLRMLSEGKTYYASLEMIKEKYGWPVGTMRKKIETFSQRLKK